MAVAPRILLSAITLFIGILLVSSPGRQSHNSVNSWSSVDLRSLLEDNGVTVPKESNRDALLKEVRIHWNDLTSPLDETSTPDLAKKLGIDAEQLSTNWKKSLGNLKNQADETWSAAWAKSSKLADNIYNDVNVWSWTFNSWSNQQLNDLLESAKVVVPSTATRKELLKDVKKNYQKLAEAAGITESSKPSYPANWLYNAWSDSDLKKWLDERGIPVPQGSKRNELIATVRKNSRTLYVKGQQARDNLQKTYDISKEDIFDKAGKIRENVFDDWSNSELKYWADSHGIPVPQNSQKDEVLAIVRRNRQLLYNDYEDSFTTKKKNHVPFIKQAEDLADQAFTEASKLWSESRLGSFLESRKIETPEGASKDDLLKLVNRYRNAAGSQWDSLFESWDQKKLEKWLSEQGQAAKGTHDQLVKEASKYLDQAQHVLGAKYDVLSADLDKQYKEAKKTSFSEWSDSDLKAYLDTYGIPTYQGSTRNELLSKARKNLGLFTRGADPNIWIKAHDGINKFLVSTKYNLVSVANNVADHVHEHFQLLPGRLERFSSWLLAKATGKKVIVV